MYAFRTKETFEAYEDHKKTGILERTCPLCTEEPLRSFSYWKVIKNSFPYDRVAEVHHMLVPFRHVREDGLTKEEKAELFELKQREFEEYSYIVEALPHKKSIPAHFHLHLLIPKLEI